MSDRSLSAPSQKAATGGSGGKAGKVGKAVGVGCLGFTVMAALCSAPLWYMGWIWSGEDKATYSVPIPAPVQSVTCGPDEWPMQWYANGKQQTACTPKW